MSSSLVCHAMLHPSVKKCCVTPLKNCCHGDQLGKGYAKNKCLLNANKNAWITVKETSINRVSKKATVC